MVNTPKIEISSFLKAEIFRIMRHGDYRDASNATGIPVKQIKQLFRPSKRRTKPAPPQSAKVALPRMEEFCDRLSTASIDARRK